MSEQSNNGAGIHAHATALIELVEALEAMGADVRGLQLGRCYNPTMRVMQAGLCFHSITGNRWILIDGPEDDAATIEDIARALRDANSEPQHVKTQGCTDD